MKFLIILFLILFIAICSIAIYDKITKNKNDELIEILMAPMIVIGFWAVYCIIVP